MGNSATVPKMAPQPKPSRVEMADRPNCIPRVPSDPILVDLDRIACKDNVKRLPVRKYALVTFYPAVITSVVTSAATVSMTLLLRKQMGLVKQMYKSNIIAAAAMPALSAPVIWKFHMQGPLLRGTETCESCFVVKGFLLNTALGVITALVATPLTVSTGLTYDVIPGSTATGGRLTASRVLGTYWYWLSKVRHPLLLAVAVNASLGGLFAKFMFQFYYDSFRQDKIMPESYLQERLVL